MNKHPRIIELYGLPGCGKTTLRDSVIQMSVEDKSFVLMSELSRQFKRLPFFTKLRYIPWRQLWCILSFFACMPKLRISEFVYYKVFFSFAIVYSFSKFARGTSFVVIDHGFAQAVVSLMNGHAGSLSEKQKERLSRIICHFKDSYFLYCHLSTETSLQRMRLRDRGNGRLDVMTNDDELRTKLLEQKEIFDSLYTCFNSIDNVKSCMIDSEQTPVECITQFINTVIKDEK